MTHPLQDQPGPLQPGAFHVDQPTAPPAVSHEAWAAPTQGPYAAQYLPAPPPVSFPGQPLPVPHPRAGQLGLAALVLAGFVTVLEIGHAVAAWSAEAAFREAGARGVAAWDVLTPMDIVALPLLLAQVAAWVVTALWLTQVRENAEALHPTVRHQRSKVWAWLGWITPVVGFWFPYQFVRDVRSATVSDERKYSTVVGWWWAAWLLYLVSKSVGSSIASDMQSSVMSGAGLKEWESVNAACAVAALVLWARIVNEVKRDQQAVALGRPTVRVLR